MRRKKRVQKRVLTRIFAAAAGICLLAAVILGVYLAYYRIGPFAKKETPEWVQEAYLTPSSYSRPLKPLKEVNNIVIHYVANPGTSAKNNRNYFDSLRKTHLTKASSHFIVGLEGEILQCVPLSEISYCSNNRNKDTVAIEVCHPDETGQFAPETYQSVVRLTAWLCSYYGLSAQDVIRHYDVTGKNCPKYYVEHEDAWQKLKDDIQAAMQNAV